MTVTSLVMPARRTDAPRKQRPVRLPLIAPKDDCLQLPVTGKLARQRIPASPGTLATPPRVRLPPRSRTGCWTCRSRKVKCDEGHPTCGQCARLGHVCDYRPRLAFRDDTRRIMERMADISTKGNVVWDVKSRTWGTKNALLSPADALPPFAMLTSDEDRERKAEASTPGTYHVIMVPDSFSGLPEYAEYTDDSVDGSLLDGRQSSVASSPISDHECGADFSDPNTVILKRFHDVSRRVLSSCRSSPRMSPASDLLGSISPLSPPPQYAPAEYDLVEGDEVPFPDHWVNQRNQDALLYAHFRAVVCRQFMPAGDANASHGVINSMADVFENEAARFPPLFHAIMAVSALSLATQEPGQQASALQHYQQAFPLLQSSLQSTQDLSSDGLFLTHFLLLVYEISCAEPNTSNLWSHHISRLLNIIFMRRSVYGTERFPFVIWWVCNFDLYALLSGASNGEFVGAMVAHHLLPSPETLLGAPTVYSPYQNQSMGNNNLSAISQMYSDTFQLAVQLGFLAASIRQPAATANSSPFSFSAHRHKDLYELMEALRERWESPHAAVLLQDKDRLPCHAAQLLHQGYTLFHTCMLYSYTSMWAGQRLEPEAASDEEVAPHVTAILQLSEQLLVNPSAGQDTSKLQFLVFPLFLAGAAATSNGMKMLAMDLLSTVPVGLARTQSMTSYLLQIIFERQAQRLMTVGHNLDIDWMEIMTTHGLQFVTFGL
ncbi:hypothetical protein ASPZODRAFT_14899 [Penicilliopsis zonata CBS 506.65]|uniref:Zn(2)-C6 fungal-type domain-containing protein n=1 Tax=Penicilliopsis zonata CBS 506.65 TaxID=1073090 RepID=A0A1L9SK15_9EURO|nr:hypothetical protein ASPZODRAFT_14899 [Penicilliopsis zonata CBS 506.65]OJJ47443.1 hypothetical protein ASPZODRAFT_14899 [Penicilliopsis zonata CBS 506.65]